MKRFATVFIVLFFTLINLWSLDLEKKYGIFKFEIHEKAGTFSLYVQDIKNGKYVPVISTVDNASGTRFFVQMGVNVYPLMPNSGVRVEQVLSDTEVRFDYTISKKFNLIVKFSFKASVAGGLLDIMQVDYTIQNTSLGINRFGVKSVYDTCLGETTLKHFSTADLVSINEEKIFNDFTQDKWIRSTDNVNSVQFLLDGADITCPNQVVIANRDFLLSNNWAPTYRNGRGFNSLFSYNNSALSLQWDPIQLAPNEEITYRFYISASNDEGFPADVSAPCFNYSGKQKNTSASVIKTKEGKPAEKTPAETTPAETKAQEDITPVPDIVISAPEVPEGNQEAVENESLDDDAVDEFFREEVIDIEIIEEEIVKEKVTDDEVLEEVENVEVIDVEITEKEAAISDEPIKIIPLAPKNEPIVEEDLTDEQLDPAYIQLLIQRIEELEKDTSNVRQEQIDALNAELDMIIQKMKD